MEPLLLDVPTELTTPRLSLRVPRAGDGAVVTPTVLASMAELKPWMPWATDAYDGQAGETWSRRAAGEFLLRRQLQYLIFDAVDRHHVGNVGLFAFRWDVGEAEIGYWLGTAFVGRGYMAEAASAVSGMAFDALSAERLVIRADARNDRSRRTAERCGFTLEGITRRSSRNSAGELRDDCAYARLR